ncbi:MAG: hypothetical protein D6800_08300, partial [Candidatus Zixiibacteriota bacterium]
MKTFLKVALPLVAAVLVVAIGHPKKTTPPWKISKQDAAFYRMKRHGKLPKALTRPSGEFYRERAYPYDHIPMDRYVAALGKARQARQIFQKSSVMQAITWTPVGPTNIPGRIVTIASSPMAPNTIYAGSAAGGVFKSTDLGATWTAVFDDVGTFPIGAIAVDPTNPDIVYVGTGEAARTIDSYEGTGIYKTTDGGLTWTFSGLP